MKYVVCISWWEAKLINYNLHEHNSTQTTILLGCAQRVLEMNAIQYHSVWLLLFIFPYAICTTQWHNILTQGHAIAEASHDFDVELTSSCSRNKDSRTNSHAFVTFWFWLFGFHSTLLHFGCMSTSCYRVNIWYVNMYRYTYVCYPLAS